MPICIECRHPVKTLYTEYSKADDRSLGKGVRLTQCPNCNRFADKYVEHDFVILFIDLVLIKPQVYRHLLFNRLGRDDDRFDRSIVRLGILLLLFDVYLTWARIEKLALPPQTQMQASASAPTPTTSSSATSTAPAKNGLRDANTNAALLQAQPLILQYLFFLLLVLSETVAFHMPIRLLCSVNLNHTSTSSPSSSSTSTSPTHSHSPSASSSPASILHTLWTYLIPHYPHPNPLSTALLVSSCTKLFPILLIIWDYDLRASATAVSWAVIVNNVAALEILMDCGYVQAGLLVAVGAACRAAVGQVVLRAVGLGTGWGSGGDAGVGGLGVLEGIWGIVGGKGG
ncbi:Arv1-like protein [Lophiostoma macrostomum CBS 122681]|uniref:Protein ARV n=1 Tax=Lophiostoma macrostomum CBS 122681 TaxID=1314788 RepID=A0A6A6TA87_9PLEO|nr:Arv1-like protein [Lophiostoma macrostomum CBS 122681]